MSVPKRSLHALKIALLKAQKGVAPKDLDEHVVLSEALAISSPSKPHSRVKISHLVGSRQKIVFALLVLSCQLQDWDFLTTCNKVYGNISLVTKLSYNCDTDLL